MISGFRCKVVENCSLLCYYAVSSGSFLSMSQYDLSVPSSGFKGLSGQPISPILRVQEPLFRVQGVVGTNYWSHPQVSRPLRMKLIGCPEMLGRNYHYLLCNNPVERTVLFPITLCLSLKGKGRVFPVHTIKE